MNGIQRHVDWAQSHEAKSLVKLPDHRLRIGGFGAMQYRAFEVISLTFDCMKIEAELSFELLEIISVHRKA